MSDRLSKELLDIEKSLGGDSNLPPEYYESDDKLQWHLDYIEDLIEEGGGSSGGGLDEDVTVEIESDYTNDSYQSRSNYATPISLKDFIANCEAGTYTNPGTIAKINNLIDGKAFRVILIGTNVDILACDGTTTTKTTWQFLDMPLKVDHLGLPFNIIDWGSNSGRAYVNTYLDGTNSSSLIWYPSNKEGYISATGLQEALHTIYEGLPTQLKHAIKTVKKNCRVKRTWHIIQADGGAESEQYTTAHIAKKLFDLSCTEAGSTSFEPEGTAYSYLNSNARRIRYYNNNASPYWVRTSRNATDNHNWVYINTSGAFPTYYTNTDNAVAPAFCI